jgi:hypothetical protein
VVFDRPCRRKPHGPDLFKVATKIANSTTFSSLCARPSNGQIDMTKLNRDAVIAVLLLILCGVLFWQTFNIREVPFSQVGSEVWPRIVLILLTVLSVIYLFKSLSDPRPASAPFNLQNWLSTYKNPLICFAMFFVFLLALPYLGMLLAGILFVFITQTLIGGASPRRLVTHAMVSVLAVGGMWMIFTYALRVILPAGELF